jgi:hypothetical protein
MNAFSINHNLSNPENIPGIPPALRFNYTFPNNFETMTEAFIKKYNWQPRVFISTITSVKQLDEDNI